MEVLSFEDKKRKDAEDFFNTSDIDSDSDGDQEEVGGTPIFLQTAPNIKMLVQLPQVLTKVNLSSIFRFVLAHFADISLLQEYLKAGKRKYLINMINNK